MNLAGNHAFEDVEGADDVVLEVRWMVAKADSHQRVGSEMEDCVAPSRALRYGLKIPDVPLDQFEMRVALVVAEVGATARKQVVQDQDVPTVFEQPVDHVAADEPRPAGDQRPFHPPAPPPSVRAQESIG